MAEENNENLVPKAHKSTARLFWQSFFIDDFAALRDYLLFEVAVPGISSVAEDIATSFVHGMFKNSTPRRINSSRSQSTLSQIYKNYSGITRTTQTGVLKADDKRSYDEIIYNRRATVDYMDIPFETPADATEALIELRDILDDYKKVSVADFYDIASKINTERAGQPISYEHYKNYTCNDYGWTDLSGVKISTSRGSWYLTLPRAVVIK